MSHTSPSRLFVPMLLLVLSSSLFAQEQDAWTLLRAVQKSYDRIQDYSATIKAEMNIPGMRAPSMEATLYYKKPDKVHVESKGFAMLPRSVVMFQPSMFTPEAFDAVVQGRQTIDGVQCSKVKLLARSDTIALQRAMLYIDPVKRRVLRMESDPAEAAEAVVHFTYTTVDGIDLPATVRLEMDAPMNMRRSGAKPKAQNENGAAAQKSTVVLRYSNYRVNKGISDSVFREKARTQP